MMITSVVQSIKFGVILFKIYLNEYANVKPCIDIVETRTKQLWKLVETILVSTIECQYNNILFYFLQPKKYCLMLRLIYLKLCFECILICKLQFIVL